MLDTSAMNEVQVRAIMEEFLGKRKVEKVAKEILAVMNAESQHIHNGKVCYIHTDETGALVVTENPVVESYLREVLTSWLEDDEIDDCIRLMMEVNPVKNEYVGLAIVVKGSESDYYTALLKHEPATRDEENFLERLEEAVDANVGDFIVPVNDPSIDSNGKLQFVPGFEPATNYSYNELEELAKENGLRLGTKNEYVLFLGTMIKRLMAGGLSEDAAWKAVCSDSKELGHYANSIGARDGLEPTGSRMVAGKCDLGNTNKILAKEEEGFCFAGGYAYCNGDECPIAHIDILLDVFDRVNVFDRKDECAVGWFVI